MNIKPLGDRVVIKLIENEETTKGGKDIKMEVKIGDKIIYSKYAGTEVKLDDAEFIIVRQSDILAIVE